MKRFANIILTLLIFAAGVVYIYLSDIELSVLRNVDLMDLGILVFLTLVNFYVNGYLFKVLVSMMDVTLSSLETVGLAILTNYGNYFGPFRAGSAMKAFYLKTSKGMPYSRFAAVLSANTFLTTFMSGAVGMMLILLLEKRKIGAPPLLLYVCAGLIIVSVMPFVIKMPGIEARNRLTRILNSAVEGFRIIRGQPRGLFFACIVFLARLGLLSLIIMFAFEALGSPVSILIAVSMSVFTSISNMISVTPNNLGVQEAVVAYMFTLSGSDFKTGFVGASLIRMVRMMITFGLAPVFTHYLMRKRAIEAPRAF